MALYSITHLLEFHRHQTDPHDAAERPVGDSRRHAENKDNRRNPRRRASALGNEGERASCRRGCRRERSRGGGGHARRKTRRGCATRSAQPPSEDGNRGHDKADGAATPQVPRTVVSSAGPSKARRRLPRLPRRPEPLREGGYNVPGHTPLDSGSFEARPAGSLTHRHAWIVAVHPATFHQ